MDALPDPPAATNAVQQAIEDLFDEVHDLDPAAREAAIAAAPVEEAVRREVRSLLRYARPGDDGASAARATGPLDPAAFTGLRADGFVLGEPIGTGGMGVVFDAVQELPTRRVAVKVLAADFARPTDLARFRRESEFLARLAHPGIARVIAAGTLAAPRGSRHPYIAMELVEGGRPITRWAEEARPSRDELVRRFIDACDAIGFGHRRGVAHLDVKPSNILVSRDGEVRVIDYGVARSLEGDERTEGRRGFAGTPQYMAPERFDAATEPDSRADVYALGLVLFELLVGRPPYSTKGCSAAEAAHVVARADIARIGRIDATVPAPLEAIVAKALARDRDARYGTASELADDLRRFLADEAVLAAPDTTVQAVGRLVRRHRVAAIVGLLALIAVVVSAGIAIAAALEAKEAAEREKREAARANQRAASAAMQLNDPAGAMRSQALVPPDLRGWEARHLEAALVRRELLAHIGSEILRVVVAKNTGEVACGITMGFLAIVDPAKADACEMHDLRPLFGEGTARYFLSLDIAPDGRRVLATIGTRRLIELDRDTGAIRDIRPEGTAMWAMYAGDRIIAIEPGGIHLLDRQSGASLARSALDVDALDLARSADGRMLLVSRADGSIALLDVDLDRLQVIERWRTPRRLQFARAIALSPDGSHALAAWRDSVISRIDCRDGSVEAESDLDDGAVFDLAFSPDGSVAVASSWSNLLRVIDPKELQVLDRISGILGHIWDIAFQPDGARVYGRCDVEIAGAGKAGATTEWLAAYDIAYRGAVVDLDLGVEAFSAEADGETGIATVACSDGSIRSVDLRTGAVSILGQVEGRIVRIARRSDAMLLGDVAGFLTRFDRGTDGSWRQAWRVKTAAGAALALAWSPDGRRIACSGASMEAAILDASDGSEIWRRKLPDGNASADRRRATQPFFLDDGTSILFGVYASTAVQPILSASDGRTLRTIESVAYECDSYVRLANQGIFIGAGNTGYLVEYGETGPIRVVDLATDGGPLGLATDGSRLVLASRDGSCRIAALDPVRELMRLDSPPGVPLATAIDLEADRVSVITSRGFIRIWTTEIEPSARARPGVSFVDQIRRRKD